MLVWYLGMLRKYKEYLFCCNEIYVILNLDNCVKICLINFFFLYIRDWWKILIVMNFRVFVKKWNVLYLIFVLILNILRKIDMKIIIKYDDI